MNLHRHTFYPRIDKISYQSVQNVWQHLGKLSDPQPVWMNTETPCVFKFVLYIQRFKIKSFSEGSREKRCLPSHFFWLHPSLPDNILLLWWRWRRRWWWRSDLSGPRAINSKCFEKQPPEWVTRENESERWRAAEKTDTDFRSAPRASGTAREQSSHGRLENI